MENASKALLIAGAILLAILLISLGIMVFTQAQSTVETSGMSQAEITAFNNKFLKYEGTKSGTEVKALVNEVIASNESNPSAQVTVTSGANVSNISVTTGTTPSVVTSGAVASEKYNVVLTYGTEGRVTSITISK